MRRYGPFASCLILAALVWAVTAPSLHYDFVYDDVAVVVQRRPFWEEGLSTFLTSNHWGTGRHATLASLDLDRLWNDAGAVAFHRTNALLMALIAVTVFALARRVMLSPAAALLAAALFAVHPVHVDAVVAVVGRAELLAALGVLLALLASIDTPSPGNLPVASLHRAAAVSTQLLQFVAVFAAALLAIFSKESAACLPLLLLAGRWSFGPRVKLVVPLAATCAAFALWALATAPLLPSGMSPEFVDNPLFNAPIFERIPKALAVLGNYLTLTLWPHPLLLDRSYAQTDPGVTEGLVAAVAWVAYGAAALALRRRNATAAFALAWFPLAFTVAGNVAFPVTTIMAERLLFLPSLGPCLLAGAAVDEVRTRGRLAPVLAAAAGAAAIAVFVALFLARAAPWASAAVYFPASAAASPRSAKAWYDLGLWLSTDRSSQESAQAAEEAWRRALAILPNFHRANYELAESLGRRGQPLAGAELYARFLEIVPDDTGALTNITRLLLAAKQPQRANAYAQRLVSLAPESDEARETLLLTEAVLHKSQSHPPSLNP